MDSTMSPKVKIAEGEGVGGMLLGSQHFGGRKVCWNSRMGLERLTSNSIIHMDLHNPNNKLVSA
jgi:hypothetical protein